jgi:putative Mn2+ efflux pump MntP
MLALVLVAVAVGFSNLAASIGIGAAGIGPGTRLRIVLIFGLLEAGMPILGLLIGHDLASQIGRQANWLAAVLLVGIGSYGVLQASRSGLRADPGPAVRRPAHPVPAEPGPAGSRKAARGPGQAGRPRESVRLLVTGLALSLDNLAAGFALGAYHVSVLAGAAVFGTVSVLMSLAGLEFGARIGYHSGQRGELIGGVVLIGVGIAVGIGTLG